jgi:hypothetical protein
MTDGDAGVSESEQPALTPEELLKAHPEMKTLDTVQKLMNSKMVFYGRTIDQDGSPVAGAEIEYNIAKYEGLTLPGMGWTIKHAVEQSDENGQFIIDEAAALHLNINAINRAGYVFAGGGRKTGIRTTPRHEGGEFYQPDPANPVIFQAWKKTEVARELKRGEGLVTPIINGQPRTIRFPDTDETVSVTFVHYDNSLTEENRGKRWWTARFSVENGGLIDSDDAFMYQAPEAGYQTTVEVSGQEHQWVSKRFYLKVLGGKIYGRIEMDMTGYYGQESNRGAVDIKYVLNPNGSRNLLSEQD